MLSAAALFGPCHGIIQHALCAHQWAYMRDICSITRLPQNTIECALEQLVDSGLVIKDPILKRYTLQKLKLHEIQSALGPVYLKRCQSYITA